MAADLTLTEGTNREKQKINTFIPDFSKSLRSRLIMFVILLCGAALIEILQFIGFDLSLVVSSLTKVGGAIGVPLVTYLGSKDNYAKLKELYTNKINILGRLALFIHRLDADLNLLILLDPGNQLDTAKKNFKNKLIALNAILFTMDVQSWIDAYEKICLQQISI